ncbi:MAG: hypothetical protein ACI4EA_11795 [Candidatus Ornithomonoglobus sp.]
MEKKDFFEDGYVKIKAAEYEKLKSEVEYLQQQVDIFRKLAFGQKSEKTKYTVNAVGQLSLFDEAEQVNKMAERHFIGVFS